MTARQGFSPEKAAATAELLGVDFDVEPFDLGQFRMGMDVELEHGLSDPETNVTDDDAVTTGKIALAHLREIPDYYSRLAAMEAQAKS